MLKKHLLLAEVRMYVIGEEMFNFSIRFDSLVHFSFREELESNIPHT